MPWGAQLRGRSLAAEVLLLSIDPDAPGLLVGRGRLARAMRAAARVEGGPSLRGALRELTTAGTVTTVGRWPRRQLTLVDRAAAPSRLRALRNGIAAQAFTTARDEQLFLLLAATGVLARRLNRDERQMARLTVDALVPEPETVSPGAVDPERLAIVVATGHSHFDSAGHSDRDGRGS